MNYFKLKKEFHRQANQLMWWCYLSDVGQWIATPFGGDVDINIVIGKISELNSGFIYEGKE